MEKLRANHLKFWGSKDTQRHLLLSIFLLVVSIAVSYFASSYTELYIGYVVPDLLLDLLPVIHVQYIFFQGAAIFMVFLLGLLIVDPRFLPFVLESSAVFSLSVLCSW